MKEKRKSKPIPFTEHESELLNWAENQGKPFATYMKDLIREDIKKHKQYNKDELKVIVKEILQEMNVKGNEVSIEKEASKLGSKGKKAYKSVLNNISK